DGTFTDVSMEAGIRGNDFGLSATWWDSNGDGLADLYVSNDFYGGDQLLRNNGDGTFTDIAAAALPHTPWYSMGSDAADLDNDGRLDLVATDMASTTHYKSKLTMGDMESTAWFLTYPEPRQYMRNAVYLNTGTGRFLEVAQLLGLAATDWTWSTKSGDLDNDGAVDLFFTNGMTRYWFNSDLRKKAALAVESESSDKSVWLDSPERAEPNLAFRNLGDLRFGDAGPEWGLDHVGVSFGAALADLDRDGDLDVIVVDFQEPVGLYRNRTGDGHATLIRLVGRESNRYGLGATVRVKTVSGVQVRFLTLAHGFASADEPLVHFGLGENPEIERLTVEWPSGHHQTYVYLSADRLHTIIEPEGAAKREPPAPPTTQFRASKALPRIRHLEIPYDDFVRQPLLPNQLSQLGPGMAWGDIDGDGDEDLYVGGGSGQPGRLFRRRDDGGFEIVRTRVFAPDLLREDMAPLFFDADGDSDLDLYVVSGGVECEPGDELLRDRLYLNDGGGGFAPAPEGTLPDLRDSGSTVVGADFDRDGDIDLFVG
ncbi:MAG: VCBS repeat-containing protein, partial [Acidobacteriota bacterium]|nr:VCBS repeat-containing protein [Acidobacteriota bacterium]